MKEVLFTDLAAMAEPASNVSRVRKKDAWEAVPYETAKYSGVMLAAMQESTADPVAFVLGLHGWYRIYLGMIMISSPMYTYLKLEGDEAYSGISLKLRGQMWAPYEIVQEQFWRCAKLDGEKLIMKHPITYEHGGSCLVWIRCEEMSEEEAAEYNRVNAEKGECRIHAHIDVDFTGIDEIDTPDDALIKLRCLKNTDVTMCTQEVSMDYSGYYTDEIFADNVGTDKLDKIRNDRFLKFHKLRLGAYQRMEEYCQSIGVRLHAGMRMEMASFQYPEFYPGFRMKFADEHPEFYIRTRDGRVVKILSYAYPEVQDYAVSILVDAYRSGFDGVTLIWIRGVSLGFEEPVLKKVAEEYPGVDGRLLPATDERLQRVRCGFMNAFMRKLRRALDDEANSGRRKRCNIHSIGCTDFPSGKEIGLDTEQWAKEGLIDGFTVGMYRHLEDIGGCMSDSTPGLIDLDKYIEYRKLHYTMRFDASMNYNLMRGGAAEELRTAKENDIEAYFSVNWEGNNPSLYVDEAAELYRLGVDGVFTWDTNSRVTMIPEWAVTSKIGHKDRLEEIKGIAGKVMTIYRVLRIDGNDIADINANWKG